MYRLNAVLNWLVAADSETSDAQMVEKHRKSADFRTFPRLTALDLVEPDSAAHSPPGAECAATPCSTRSKRLWLGKLQKFHVGAPAARRTGCSPGWSAARVDSPTVSGLVRTIM